MVDVMTMGVISSPKTRKQRPKNASVSCHAGDSKEPLSLNSGLTVNSSDQSPNHLSIKFVIYSPIFLHKSMMNVTFSNKKCSRHCFHPRFFLSHFLSFRFLWTEPRQTLTFSFWNAHETPNLIARYRPLQNVSIINNFVKFYR